MRLLASSDLNVALGYPFSLFLLLLSRFFLSCPFSRRREWGFILRAMLLCIMIVLVIYLLSLSFVTSNIKVDLLFQGGESCVCIYQILQTQGGIGNTT